MSSSTVFYFSWTSANTEAFKQGWYLFQNQDNLSKWKTLDAVTQKMQILFMFKQASIDPKEEVAWLLQ